MSAVQNVQYHHGRQFAAPNSWVVDERQRKWQIQKPMPLQVSHRGDGTSAKRSVFWSHRCLRHSHSWREICTSINTWQQQQHFTKHDLPPSHPLRMSRSGRRKSISEGKCQKDYFCYNCRKPTLSTVHERTTWRHWRRSTASTSVSPSNILWRMKTSTTYGKVGDEWHKKRDEVLFLLLINVVTSSASVCFNRAIWYDKTLLDFF